MNYTWLGKKAEIVIEEKYEYEYGIFVVIENEPGISAGIVEERKDGTFTAFASGNRFHGETIEQAAIQAVDYKHQAAADHLERIRRVNEHAAVRAKKKQEEQDRQEAFK